jgi:hypothetical protein
MLQLLSKFGIHDKRIPAPATDPVLLHVKKHADIHMAHETAICRKLTIHNFTGQRKNLTDP